MLTSEGVSVGAAVVLLVVAMVGVHVLGVVCGGEGTHPKWCYLPQQLMEILSNWTTLCIYEGDLVYTCTSQGHVGFSTKCIR